MYRCILVLSVLVACDVEPDVPEPDYSCALCVNEKTCPDDECDPSAYEACLRAKQIARICE